MEAFFLVKEVGNVAGEVGVESQCDAVVGRCIELTTFVPSDKKMLLSSPLPDMFVRNMQKRVFSWS